jgi:UDP-glucuronate decarboxylase
VDDLVDGLILMMNSSESITGPINLGNPGEFKISELADMVLNKIGSNSSILYYPLPQDDPKKRKPDIEEAKLKLSWNPSTDLGQGLELTIKYFKAILGLAENQGA